MSTTLETAVVHVGATHSSGQLRARLGRGGASGPRHELVTSIPRSQLYYWSAEWQRLEADALLEIRAGKAMRFETPNDAIRWLLSDDD